MVVLVARTRDVAVLCPVCGTATAKVHGYHHRTVKDVPVDGRQVVVHLRVRRLVCPAWDCRQQTFREQIPGLLERHQRRTVRLVRQISQVAHELCGRAARTPGWPACCARVPQHRVASSTAPRATAPSRPPATSAASCSPTPKTSCPACSRSRSAWRAGFATRSPRGAGLAARRVIVVERDDEPGSVHQQHSCVAFWSGHPPVLRLGTTLSTPADRVAPVPVRRLVPFAPSVSCLVRAGRGSLDHHQVLARAGPRAGPAPRRRSSATASCGFRRPARKARRARTSRSLPHFVTVSYWLSPASSSR